MTDAADAAAISAAASLCQTKDNDHILFTKKRARAINLRKPLGEYAYLRFEIIFFVLQLLFEFRNLHRCLSALLSCPALNQSKSKDLLFKLQLTFLQCSVSEQELLSFLFIMKGRQL